MNQEIGLAEVSQICAKHRIDIRDLESVIGSFDKRIFFINHNRLLRVSETTMDGEQARFRRVAALDSVPKIQHVGVLEREAGPLYYTLLTCLPGDDFVNAYSETTLAQQLQLGKDVVVFLDDLHALAGTHYDIGFYIPVIPNFTGTWREGHRRYWELLERGTESLQLKPESIRMFDIAFQFLDASAEALDEQTGPKLLHNDLHPKNILLDRGRFSGAIDWECSQYGEVDFELCHFIHWCAYPPRLDIDYRPFLGALLQASPQCAKVPGLAKRLTIYQVDTKYSRSHGTAARLRLNECRASSVGWMVAWMIYSDKYAEHVLGCGVNVLWRRMPAPRERGRV